MTPKKKKTRKKTRNIEMCYQITDERLQKKYWSRPWDISQNRFKHPHGPQISQVGKTYQLPQVINQDCEEETRNEVIKQKTKRNHKAKVHRKA